MPHKYHLSGDWDSAYNKFGKQTEKESFLSFSEERKTLGKDVWDKIFK